VAGTGTGAKKYVVKLSMEERERLEAVISSGKRSAQLITKARILLKADSSDAGDGWTDREIAAALDASVNTVGSVRRQLVECQIASNRDPLSRPILTPLARDGILLGQGNATTRMRMRRRCRSGVRA
jgi:hypothetical protein